MKCPDCKLFGKCREIRAASQEKFKWSYHNIIAHPLSEIVYWFGFKDLSDKIHNDSIPEHEEGTGRG